MSRDYRAMVRAWRTYAGSGIGTRAFLAARLVIVPLGRIDADLRVLSGRVLSLGPGHGLLERYLAEINPHVSVDGFELDAARVSAAAETQDRAPRVRILHADVTGLDEPGIYDAALAVDVMHHVAGDQHSRVAKALWDRLRPGATVLVKDMDVRPRWKWAWNRTHDRIVAGPEPTYCRSAEDMSRLFEAVGFRTVEIRNFDRLDPYPQYLVLLERPAVTAV
jgi:cyclopropane fatty-acyl-phospholipid synthase-like methyltransferase